MDHTLAEAAGRTDARRQALAVLDLLATYLRTGVARDEIDRLFPAARRYCDDDPALARVAGALGMAWSAHLEGDDHQAATILSRAWLDERPTLCLCVVSERRRRRVYPAGPSPLHVWLRHTDGRLAIAIDASRVVGEYDAERLARLRARGEDGLDALDVVVAEVRGRDEPLDAYLRAAEAAGTELRGWLDADELDDWIRRAS